MTRRRDWCFVRSSYSGRNPLQLHVHIRKKLLCYRQEIQLFEPLPSQLAYPDILERCYAQKSDKDVDLTATWYPPLTSALSLLSKMYGVVDRSVFEDFARRTTDDVLVSLRKATDGNL